MARMRIFLVAALAAVAVPVVGRAQQTPAQKADELVQRAQALQSDLAAYRVAANLYEESAALRSAGDARAEEALVTAGRLYSYAGDAPHALAALEAAAARALKDGDALTAAHAYADAAYVAARSHDDRAINLAQRVLKLAEYLDPAERAEALGRLGPHVVQALQAEPNPVIVLALR